MTRNAIPFLALALTLTAAVTAASQDPQQPDAQPPVISQDHPPFPASRPTAAAPRPPHRDLCCYPGTKFLVRLEDELGHPRNPRK